MIAIGIDLGVNGAIAIHTDDSVTVQPLPILDDRTLDADALCGLVNCYSMNPDVLAVFEGVFRPNSLVRMQGEVAATLKLSDVNFIETPVVTWKKRVLGVNSSDKKIVLDWCKRTYPAVSLRRTPRARTDSHDFADAIAIGHYAKELLSERNANSSNGSGR